MNNGDDGDDVENGDHGHVDDVNGEMLQMMDMMQVKYDLSDIEPSTCLAYGVSDAPTCLTCLK